MKIKDTKELALFLDDLRAICEAHKVDFECFDEISLTNIKEDLGEECALKDEPCHCSGTLADKNIYIAYLQAQLKKTKDVLLRRNETIRLQTDSLRELSDEVFSKDTSIEELKTSINGVIKNIEYRRGIENTIHQRSGVNTAKEKLETVLRALEYIARQDMIDNVRYVKGTLGAVAAQITKLSEIISGS